MAPSSARLRLPTAPKLRLSCVSYLHNIISENTILIISSVDVGTDNALLGSPNATDTSPTWSNLTFNVPDTTASGHQVSFSNSTNSTTGRSSSGFLFYGQYLFHQSTGGDLKSEWYALPSGQDGVWSLNWNSTGDDTDGKVIVTLRAIAPSSGSDTSTDTTS